MQHAANFYETLLGHLHSDSLSELEWLEKSFENIKFPIFEEEEKKQFDKKTSLDPFLQVANAFFRDNPHLDQFPVTDADGTKSLHRAEFDFIVRLMREKQNQNQRNSELSEILQINQIFIIFEAFLLDATKLLYKAFPSHLKTEQQITYKEALELTSLKKIHDYLIERTLGDRSYKSIQKQFQAIEKTFKINFAISDAHYQELTAYKEVRNLHVHKKGIADSEFVTKTSHLPDSYRPMTSSGFYQSVGGSYYIQRFYDLVRQFIWLIYSPVMDKLKKSQEGIITSAMLIRSLRSSNS